MNKEDDKASAQRRRDISIWVAAAADTAIGFLVAMFGDAWFGLGRDVALWLGLAVAAVSVGCAIFMTSRGDTDESSGD